LDLPQLELLGKVAGIGGIAIGAVVVIFREILDKSASIPLRQRAAMLRLVAIGAFSLGALGIMAWLASGWFLGQTAATRGNDSPAIISGGNVTIGPASATGPAAPSSQIGAMPNATAKSAGDRSPAIVSGGNTTVAMPTTTPKPP